MPIFWISPSDILLFFAISMAMVATSTLCWNVYSSLNFSVSIFSATASFSIMEPTRLSVTLVAVSIKLGAEVSL